MRFRWEGLTPVIHALQSIKTTKVACQVSGFVRLEVLLCLLYDILYHVVVRGSW